MGFKLDFGDDGSGWQFKYLTRGGGYYFNVGCSDMVAEGKIALKQFADIESFVADGARMRDGETLRADLVVLATGYKGQEHLVRKLFGDDIAARVGPIWGFDDEQELRNMFVRTRQPGLVVHRRQPRAVPHLFEVPRAADQGAGGRAAGAGEVDAVESHMRGAGLGACRCLLFGEICGGQTTHEQREIRCRASGRRLLDAAPPPPRGTDPLPS